MKKLFIFLFLLLCSFQSISDEPGVISLMYHRVGEGKYPSTNVSVEMFKQHLKDIEESGLKFIEPSKVKTFSIGLEGSPDLIASEKVAKYLGTDHTSVVLSEDEMYAGIEETIYQIELNHAPLLYIYEQFLKYYHP